MKNVAKIHIYQAIAGFLAFGMIATLVQAKSDDAYDVVVRTKRGGFEVAPRPIAGLLAPNRFETPHFRVVWKKEETALSLARIDAIVEEKRTTEKENPLWAERTTEEIRLMAANALYHAEIARTYFTEELRSEEVDQLEPIIIRLDLSNFFSEHERFAHDNYKPQFNNALSIDGGTPYNPRPGVGPWKREIWFRPRKEILTRELLALLPEDPANGQIRQIRSVLYPMQIDLAIRNTLYTLFQGVSNTSGYIDSMTRQAGTLLMIEGAFQVMKVVNHALLPKYFYLDSAMVPEIIYHEFSHIALSDFMRLDVSTPVNEGMADFFAAYIGGSPHLAKKIKKFSTSVSKNGKKRQYFRMEFEMLDKARADFVLSLLWGLREVLGETPTLRLVWGTRKYLTTKDSTIRDGLVRALLQSCDTNCESPLRDRMLIQQYLQERGI